MRVRAALAGATLLAVTIITHGSARPPSEQRPLSDLAFRPVAVPHRDREEEDPSPTLKSTPPPPTPTLEPAPALTRPPVKQPEVKARVQPKATKVPASRTGHSARGVPTYYCRAGRSVCTHGYPDVAGNQMYAAAGPSLRVGNWRGRVVTVTAPSGKSVQVKLIDWCACGGSHFIDLYYDAFKLLGSPSSAKVTW